MSDIELSQVSPIHADSDVNPDNRFQDDGIVPVLTSTRVPECGMSQVPVADRDNTGKVRTSPDNTGKYRKLYESSGDSDDEVQLKGRQRSTRRVIAEIHATGEGPEADRKSTGKVRKSTESRGSGSQRTTAYTDASDNYTDDDVEPEGKTSTKSVSSEVRVPHRSRKRRSRVRFEDVLRVPYLC